MTPARAVKSEGFEALTALRAVRSPAGDDLSTHERLIFVLLVSHADDVGVAYPSHDLLEKEASCSRRQVVRVMARLEATGWIKTRPVGGHDEHKLTPKAELKRAEVVTDRHHRGDSQSPLVVTMSHHQTLDVGGSVVTGSPTVVTGSPSGGDSQSPYLPNDLPNDLPKEKSAPFLDSDSDRDPDPEAKRGSEGEPEPEEIPEGVPGHVIAHMAPAEREALFAAWARLPGRGADARSAGVGPGFGPWVGDGEDPDGDDRRLEGEPSRRAAPDVSTSAPSDASRKYSSDASPRGRADGLPEQASPKASADASPPIVHRDIKPENPLSAPLPAGGAFDPAADLGAVRSAEGPPGGPSGVIPSRSGSHPAFQLALGGAVAPTATPKPPRAPKPKKPELAKHAYAKAYAEGQVDAGAEGFPPPHAYSTLVDAAKHHAKRDGVALGGDELLAWFRTTSAEYRRAKASAAQFESGFAPSRFLAWLNAGRPQTQARIVTHQQHWPGCGREFESEDNF